MAGATCVVLDAFDAAPPPLPAPLSLGRPTLLGEGEFIFLLAAKGILPGPRSRSYNFSYKINKNNLKIIKIYIYRTAPKRTGP